MRSNQRLISLRPRDAAEETRIFPLRGKIASPREHQPLNDKHYTNGPSFDVTCEACTMKRWGLSYRAKAALDATSGLA